MLDLLVEAPGLTVGALASHFDFSRIAAMKHLAVLEQAELVIGEKHGRTRKLWFNAVPIQRIYDRWTDRYASFFASHIVDVQQRVESRAQARKRG